MVAYENRQPAHDQPHGSYDLIAPKMDNQCTATAKSTGDRCQRPSIKGGTVCYQHGGAASQVQKKAQERLDRMADSVTADAEVKLNDLIDRYDESDSIDEKLAIIAEIRKWEKIILDRTGHGPTDKRELSTPDGEEGFGTTVVLDSEYVSDE